MVDSQFDRYHAALHEMLHSSNLPFLDHVRVRIVLMKSVIPSGGLKIGETFVFHEGIRKNGLYRVQEKVT